MDFPFTVDQFLDVFRQYNEAIWPAQIFLNLLAFIAIVLAFWKKPYSGKLISYILAFLWFWTGIIYHILFFSTINPIARVFGSIFILQGGLFHWIGGVRNRIEYEVKFDLRGSLGLVFVFYGLLIYPLLGTWIGHVYPMSPTFGAPCPTTIFTFGVLLWTQGKFPRFLLIIPAFWSLLGFTAASTMGIKEDLGLLVAGIVGTTLLSLPKKIVTPS